MAYGTFGFCCDLLGKFSEEDTDIRRWRLPGEPQLSAGAKPSLIGSGIHSLFLAPGSWFLAGRSLSSWKVGWGGAGSKGARARRGSELAPGLSLVGGSQNLRFYWKEFVNEVDVLVFVVDSADRLRLPWARQELHKLLDKDPDLPVVVVANKQVRATGGRLRPVGLDPQMPGQEQLHLGEPRP